MNTISRTISGLGSAALGIYIALASYLSRDEGWIWGIVIGLFFIGLGVYLFFNKREDDIEEIKK